MSSMDIHDQYYFSHMVGTGGFSEVWCAVHVATSQKVAIKKIDKSQNKDELHRIKREYETLKKLSHKYICQLYQFLEDPDYIYLVLEYCPGGELFDYIVDHGRLGESEAQHFFQQIILSVSHVHSLGFVHRDLKPENFLLDENNDIKLVDFGLCASLNGVQEKLSTSCGSVGYAAPEVMKGLKYLGEPADVWSLGIMLYATLCGFLPFNEDEYMRTLSSEKEITYELPPWLSDDATELLSKMLFYNPNKRITMAELLNHPWFVGKLDYGNSWNLLLPLEPLDPEVLAKMSRVLNTSYSRVEKLVLLWNYDYLTSIYLILLRCKLKGESLDCFKFYPVLAVKNSPEFSSKFDPTLNDVSKSLEAGLNDHLLLELGSPSKLKISGRSHENALLNHNKGDTSMSKSFDSGINDIENCPPGNPKVKTPFKQKKLKGIMKHLGKKVDVFGTPFFFKRSPNQIRILPQVTSNVSSTNSKNPDEVICSLYNALMKKGIKCIRKGYTIIGNTCSGRTSTMFELEICLLPGSNKVAVRRNRLNGDSWVYKDICEEVLKLTCMT